jgi:DNA-binding MarR family transcriptional regulator
MSMSPKITDTTTEQVYHFLCKYHQIHGYAPSLREIGATCYIGRSTVLRHLDRLEAFGLIARSEGRARGIQLLPKS